MYKTDNDSLFGDPAIRAFHCGSVILRHQVTLVLLVSER